LETNAASHTSSATDITVIAVAVTTGFILVAVAIIAIAVVFTLDRNSALARKIGRFQHPASRNEMPERVCGMVIVE
jgi:hypothetical protein